MPLVYAHRGLHTVARENTLEAFAAAVALGVDGVELDVRRTLDGHLVVHHDATAEGLVIAQSERRSLPGHVADLRDALQVLATVEVNVEIKNIRHASEPTYDETGDFAREVVTLIHESGHDHPVIVSSFDLATCAVVRAADPEIAVGWLWWDVEPLEALELAHGAQLNAVHPHYIVADHALVARARELGLGVNVWTVNQASDIAAMSALGVSSIITDDPALALETRG